MTKAILKKSLALLISVMLVLTAMGGALAVFAEDAVVEEVAFDYGTEADGFNTRAESGANDGNPTINQVPVLEVPTNLNFKEGLKYWTTKSDRSGIASQYATVYTSANGEKYIGMNIDNNQFDGITTPWFGLGDIADGTQIYVFTEYMLNGKLTDTGWNVFGNTPYPVSLSVYQQDAEGTFSTLRSKHETVPMDDAQKNGIWSTQAVHEFTYTAGATYRIQIQDGMVSDADAIVDAETGEITKEAITTRADIAALTDGEAAIFVKGLRFCTLNADGTYTEIGTGAQLYKTGIPVGGTEAEGIPVQMINGGWYEIYNWGTNAKGAKNTDLYVPQEGFQNGDFSQGFKYWTVRWPGKGYGINSVDDAYDLVDGYVQFKGNEKNYLGIGSAPFKLSNVKAGDKLVATASVKNNGGMALMLNLGEVGVDNVSITDRSNTTDWVNIATPELTVSADNATIAVMFESHAGTTAGHSIDNVRVLKVNADGTYTDVMTGDNMYADGSPVQPLGGTEADGIIASDNNFVGSTGGSLDTTNYAFGIADSFTNYDFSQGFKYYSLRYNSSYDDVNSISDMAEITAEGSLKFTGHPFNYAGVVTMPFYVEGVKAGDKLMFATKYKGNSFGIELRLYENNTRIAGYTCGTKVTDWATTATPLGTVTSGDSHFWLEIQNNGDNTGMELDDFMLLKDLGNGTYLDLFRNDLYYKDGRPVGGTYEDGWYANGGGETSIYAGTYDAFNGDFSAGLRYWCWQANTSKKAASDAATLKVEDGNEYVTIKNDQAAWAGIRTMGFKLNNVEAGDKLTVMFNYRNGDLNKHRFFLGVENADKTDTVWSLKNDTYATAVVLPDGNSWGTAVNKNYITVGSALTTKTPGASYPAMTLDVNDQAWFYVEIENTEANVGIDIDNIQVVKYINPNTVETLDGERIVFEPTWVGTFSGGATVSGNNTLDKFYPDYGLYNGDFEEGLKYWAGRGTSVAHSTINDYVNLVQTEDNNYVQFNGVTATAYSGLMTAKISIPAATFAQGDMATLVVDVYDPDNTMNNVQAVLFVYNGSTEIRLGQGTLNNAKVIADKGNGWKTMIVPYTASTINFTSAQTSTVAEGDWAMALCFEVPTGKASTTAIDNIKIVKRVTDYSVVSIDGETIAWAPDWAGTFEGGAAGAGAQLNSKYSTEYGVTNGDFSEGLKYWGATGGTATAITDYVDLVNDGDNYYIQLDGVARDGYCGFRSGYLCIPAADLQIGDYVALKFDIYDPDNTASAFQVILESRGCESGRVSLTYGNDLKVVTDHGNGWKTVVTEFDSAIAAACTEAGAFKSGDWVFSIAVEVITSNYEYVVDENGEATDVIATDEEGNPIWKTERKSTAAFDNFEIVRADRGGFGKDALAVALDGSAVGDVNYGDANKDGKVDLVDLVRAKKYAAAVAGGANASAISFVATDVDNSKAIDAADFTAIINKILGIVA